MTDDFAKVYGFMSGVVYSKAAERVHERFDSYANAVRPEDKKRAEVFLKKGIEEWWSRASEVGRTNPPLRSWVKRDRDCFLEVANHVHLREWLETLLPQWPSDWE